METSRHAHYWQMVEEKLHVSFVPNLRDLIEADSDLMDIVRAADGDPHTFESEKHRLRECRRYFLAGRHDERTTKASAAEGGRQAAHRSGQITVPPQSALLTLTDEESARGRGVSAWVARQAGLTPEVRRYRSMPDAYGEDEFGALCSEVMRLYQWSEEQATRFLRDPNAPPPDIRPLQVSLAVFYRSLPESDFWGSRVSVEVQPWVSVESVASTYTKIRQMILGPRQRATDRIMRLFAFIEERHTGERLKWADLCREWNAAHPDLAYTSYREVWRDYRRAKERIFRIFTEQQDDAIFAVLQDDAIFAEQQAIFAEQQDDAIFTDPRQEVMYKALKTRHKAISEAIGTT